MAAGFLPCSHFSFPDIGSISAKTVYLWRSLSTFFNAIKISIHMGRGDARTKRGKISRGSHGKSRPKLEKIKTVLKKQAAAAN